jgi:hypothetical protein
MGDYIIPVQSFSGMKAKKDGPERVLNREVLITNFAPPTETLSERIEPQQITLGI